MNSSQRNTNIDKKLQRQMSTLGAEKFWKTGSIWPLSTTQAPTTRMRSCAVHSFIDRTRLLFVHYKHVKFPFFSPIPPPLSVKIVSPFPSLSLFLGADSAVRSAVVNSARTLTQARTHTRVRRLYTAGAQLSQKSEQEE